MVKGEKGFTLLEVAVSLAIGSILMAGIAGTVWQFQRFPENQTARLVLQQEMRTATTWVRLDANKAQSFQAGSGNTYGTFRWLDFSTFPATRRKAVYFWEEGTVLNPSATAAPFNYGILFRQPYTEGTPEPKIPLMRHVASASDIAFTVTEAVHEANRFSTKRTLSLSVTSTIEAGASGTLRESSSLTVELRPEQLSPLDHRYFFLHNNPTPPTGNTNSQTTLPMDSTQSTATTLYNYDANRDSYPGLFLVRGPAGGKLDLPDTAKFQDWASDPPSSNMVIDGRVSLFINLAAFAFEQGKLITLGAWLLDLDPATGTFVVMAKKGEVNFTGQAGWTAVSMHFLATLYTIPQGHKLALRIQYDGMSEAEGMVAYDTTAQLAFLSVPAQP